MIPFVQRLKVMPEHLDRQNHVNNVAFVKMIQDVAAAHWRSLVTSELLTQVTWVCRRHEIDYLKPGRWDDDLELRTWVGEPTGATWERFTDIVRPADAAIVVKARTVWVLIDVASGRPRRIDAAIRAVLINLDSKADDQIP
jgi:acyl-CoA thioester hydrolase